MIRRLRLMMTVVGLLLPGLASCAGNATQPQSAEPADTPTASPASSATPTPGPTTSSPTTPSPEQSTPQAAPPVDCAVVACVALTYDDGPSPLTNQLLDTYESRQAVATFFLLGSFVSNDPDTVLRTSRLGMEIGNHTTNHPHLPGQTAEAIDAEIAETQQHIWAVTGSYPTLLRPPYGERNELVDQIAGSHGLSVIGWTDGPADWENTDTDTVVALTLSRVRPGAIILMHDTHQWTVDAAPRIIDGLRAQGYTLVTVSQIIGTPQPGMLYFDGQAPA